MESVLAWLSHYGYAGLFGLLVLGIVGLPIPDETLLVFSGYLISRGRMQAPLAFCAGFAGSICGISLSYWIGRTVGHSILLRYGKFVRVTQEPIGSRPPLVSKGRRMVAHFRLFHSWRTSFYGAGRRHV